MIPINHFWIILILSVFSIFIIVFIYKNLLKTSRKQTDDLLEAIGKFEDHPRLARFNLTEIYEKIKEGKK